MTTGMAAKESLMKPKHFIDLGRLFERVVRSFGADEVKVLASLPETPGLSLERSVPLTGTLNGTLMVRSTPEFAEWLRSQRQHSFQGRYPAEEIFEELVSLFCLYLFHGFWQPQSFQIGPIKPYPSLPSQWPSVPPETACAVEVEGHRVELRLWLET